MRPGPWGRPVSSPEGVPYKSVTLETVAATDYGLVAVLVSRHGLDLDRFVAAGVPVFDAAYALTGHAASVVERL